MTADHDKKPEQRPNPPPDAPSPLPHPIKPTPPNDRLIKEEWVPHERSPFDKIQ